MYHRVLAMCAPLLWLFATSALHAQTLEDSVLAQINDARVNPRGYAEKLRQYRSYFDGEIVYMPGDYNGVLTKEGTAVVDETIAFLERQEPLLPLTQADILALAATDFSREQGAIGARGHKGADGSDPGVRVKRRGGDIFVGEAIAYGFDDAEQIVRQMIVDDGVPDRGHRRLLYDAKLKFAGIGCGPHSRMDHICVVDLSATKDGRPVRVRYAQQR
ncbi:CAP domain-containing protein [Sphingomonas pituitosa]|uniref:CAP domain-containing protein n=1 Tax=Sphingomonas pituitosa TaxID=99597 RepID=UPI00082B756D|nr:CAP domain-containing protein [Sphingomonas pituitosa]